MYLYIYIYIYKERDRERKKRSINARACSTLARCCFWYFLCEVFEVSSVLDLLRVNVFRSRSRFFFFPRIRVNKEKRKDSIDWVCIFDPFSGLSEKFLSGESEFFDPFSGDEAPPLFFDPASVLVFFSFPKLGLIRKNEDSIDCGFVLSRYGPYSWGIGFAALSSRRLFSSTKKDIKIIS